jgi:hypothetical protein
LFDEILWWYTKQFHNACQLLLLVFSREQWVASKHFGQDTTQRPHIDRDSVTDADDNFGGAVETALNVGVHFFIFKAAASEIDDLDFIKRGCEVKVWWDEGSRAK